MTDWNTLKPEELLHLKKLLESDVGCLKKTKFKLKVGIKQEHRKNLPFGKL